MRITTGILATVFSFIIHSQFLTSAAFANAGAQIRIDGSSTVYPISEAVAEEFQKKQPKTRVTIGTSGTGGGFKKFSIGETDISNASRHIKAEEAAIAKKNGIEFKEVAVAYDGITMVIHPENDWCKDLTVAELKKIWEPGSKIKKWSEVRKGWPDKPLNLYGPGTDSGTFDFFTEAVNGKAQASREDFQKSEDDNMLVQGVSGDKNALGYFGYAYYIENQKKLKAVPVVSAGKPVMPTEDTIAKGTYKPLSRPIYIYVSKKAAKRTEVKEFVNFFIEQAPALVKQVRYIPMSKSEYAKTAKDFSAFAN
jgi:phosphate transport system substrate-binding protein